MYRSSDGSIFVEDLKDGGETSEYYRQVVFSSKPEQIQSEVILHYRSSKKEESKAIKSTVSPVAPKKKQRILTFNHELLCCEYQYAMLAGPSLTLRLLEKTGLRVLVLGTGAGLLPTFLRQQLDARLAEVITLDINEEVLKIARDYFGFEEDSKLKSVIADAYKYVIDYQVGSQADKFDMVFMDVNYEEGNIQLSPPRKFLTTEFLAKLMVSTPFDTPNRT